MNNIPNAVVHTVLIQVPLILSTGPPAVSTAMSPLSLKLGVEG